MIGDNKYINSEYSDKYPSAVSFLSLFEWPLFLLVSIMILTLSIVYTIQCYRIALEGPTLSIPNPIGSNFATTHVPIAQMTESGVNHHALQTSSSPYPKTLASQLKAIQKEEPMKILTIKSGDTLINLFEKEKINRTDYYALLKIPTIKTAFTKLNPKHTIQVSVDPQHHLKKLTYEINHTQYVEAINDKGQWKAAIKDKMLQLQLQKVSGTVSGSLADTIKKMELPNSTTAQLESIFNSKIDFSKQIYSGDQFKILYEEYFDNGKPIQKGNIIAAEFVNQSHEYWAIRYRNELGRTDYYTPDGKSVHSAFMRAPLHYNRISSKFNSQRMHPILHTVKPHEGVDFAAPMGTPIKAASDGRIIFRGRKGGYGKVVIIRHNGRYTTLYAHLSRFANNQHVNSYVQNGDLIGYVGESGFATGPHLHYEFHVNGVPRDPLTVKLPSAQSVSSKEIKNFTLYASQLVQQLS